MQVLRTRAIGAGRGRRHGLLAVAALAVAALAVAAWPGGDPDEVWRRAEADFRAGNWGRAEGGLRRLARMRAPQPQDRLLQAQLAMARGRTEEALALLEQVPAGHVLAVEARQAAGMLELRRGRLRMAEREFLRALEEDPRRVPVRRELVYIYGMQSRKRELSEQMEALAELAPLTFDEVFLWSLPRGSVWDAKELSTDLERFLEADPEDRYTRLALADSLLNEGRREEAERVLRALPEEDLDARVVRARLAQAEGDGQRLEALLAAEGRHPVLALLRGQQALRRRDAAAAIAAFREAARDDPLQRDAWHGLAQALVLGGRQEELERCREWTGKLDALSSALQRVYSAAGRRDAGLMSDVAEACEAVGRPAEARAWYRLAIGLEPLNERAQRALYRLGAGDAKVPGPPQLGG